MTIFAKIIAGEVPCHRVYEDDKTLAFLDVAPLSRGHTLVIPKEPAVTIDTLSDDAAAALGRAVVRVARAVKAATGCSGYNLLQNNGASAGQVVMHAHVHVIPRYASPPAGSASGTGLAVHWSAGKGEADAAELAKAIARAAGQ